MWNLTCISSGCWVWMCHLFQKADFFPRHLFYVSLSFVILARDLSQGPGLAWITLEWACRLAATCRKPRPSKNEQKTNVVFCWSKWRVLHGAQRSERSLIMNWSPDPDPEEEGLKQCSCFRKWLVKGGTSLRLGKDPKKKRGCFICPFPSHKAVSRTCQGAAGQCRLEWGHT